MSKNAIVAVTLLIVVAFLGFLLLRDGTENVTNGTQQVTQVVDDQNKNTPKNETMVNEDPANSSDDLAQPPAEPPLPEKPSAATVTYSNSGFSPSTVTISKGEAVEFVNESGRNMWPSSNFHPTHSIYPEKTDADCLGSAFDVCRRIPKGESWTFTFDHVGSWKYHDHLTPVETGIIIVQ